MSKREQEPQTGEADMGGPPSIANYTVGYKRPPLASRFKPGQSGNPKGRPVGSANAKTTVQRVMNERVSVRRGEKTSSVTTLEAMVQAHAVKAVKGDPRSANMVINVMTRTGLLADPESGSARDSTNSRASAYKARSSDALFENIDPVLLARDEMIELSRLAAIIDLGGDVTALNIDDFQRLKELVNKGRGTPVTLAIDTSSR